MFYDADTMEIIVRSVALAAFVETPRDRRIIAERRPGRAAPGGAIKTAGTGPRPGLRALGRVLSSMARGAGERLGRLAQGAPAGHAGRQRWA